MSNNVKDPKDKPDPQVLQCILNGYPDKLGPIAGRSISYTYWEHILLRYVGDVPLDIKRNYSEKLVLSLVGTFERILKGHAGTLSFTSGCLTNLLTNSHATGITESARLLNSVVPTTEYKIAGTVVDSSGGWVTERWGYYDKKNNIQICDGIDTFLIYDSQIAVKMINYTVECKLDDEEEFKRKLGIS